MAPHDPQNWAVLKELEHGYYIQFNFSNLKTTYEGEKGKTTEALSGKQDKRLVIQLI